MNDWSYGECGTVDHTIEVHEDKHVADWPWVSTAHYMAILDFFVQFTLDENFKEIIKSRHRDIFSYSSFSEGAKLRIDLALLFTWRQIAAMKNSMKTNLLLLDETFDSSLDTDGVDNLLKILDTLEENTSVFVISHKKDMLDSKFPRKLTYKKINNFSVCFED